MIYFARTSHDGPVKIGFVENEYKLDTRLNQLQTANSDEVYIDAVMLGDRGFERELHARFAEGRIRGEWFRADTPGLHRYIFEAVQREPMLDLFKDAA